MVGIISGYNNGLIDSSLNRLGLEIGDAKLGQVKGAARVNIATGNLVLQFEDEHIHGSAGIDLIRTYNSQGVYDQGVLGTVDGQDRDGWSVSGAKRMELYGFVNDAESSLHRFTDDGAEEIFLWDAAKNMYVSERSFGGGSYNSAQIDTESRRVYWFDSTVQDFYGPSNESYIIDENADLTGAGFAARLEGAYDKVSGNYFSYVNGKLASVTDSHLSQTIFYNYSGNRLESISTQRNGTQDVIKQVYYTYDTQNRLYQVKTDLSPDDGSIADGKVFTTTYTYDGNSLRIASISSTDARRTSFTYEVYNSSFYRIKTVTDSEGTLTFNYLKVLENTLGLSPSGYYKTQVTNSLGETWTYYYSTDTYQLLRYESPDVDGVKESKTFNYYGDGNVKSMKDGRGNITNYGYDERGNRISEVDALGNTVTRVFNTTKNQLISETRYSVASTTAPGGAETTWYIYAGGGVLAGKISPEGQVTRYTYDTAHSWHLGKITVYNARYNTSALNPAIGLSYASFISWVNAQDKTKIQLTTFQYDSARNDTLSKKTEFKTVDSLGNGVVDGNEVTTDYIYTEHGQLVSEIVKAGSSSYKKTDYAYDGLGRILTSTNDEGTSLYSYYSALTYIDNTSTNRSAGFVRNPSGDVRYEYEMGIDTAVRLGKRYVYDSANRLISVRDYSTSDGLNYYFYNAAGRVAFEVDSAGAVIGYIYDADGRVKTQTQYASPIDLSLLFVNGVQKSKLVVGGEILTTGSDRKKDYAYDNAGRFTGTIETDGTTTTVFSIGYDGASRVVSENTSTIRNALNGSTSLPIFQSIKRYYYNRDGQLIGVKDGQGYFTENVYDIFGRLTKQIRYSTSIGDTDNFAAAKSAANIPNTNKQVTLYYYDRLGREIGHIDEKGFLTETVYLQAANQRKEIHYAKAIDVTPLIDATGAQDEAALSALRAVAGDKVETEFTFDEQGRLVKTITPDGSIARNEYDAAGRLLRSIAAEGTSDQRATRYRYNDLNMLTGVVSGVAEATYADLNTAIASGGTTYVIDAFGRKTAEKGPQGQITYFYYDLENRLKFTINALGEVSETSYNAFGEVSETRIYNNRVAKPDGTASGAVADMTGVTGGLASTIAARIQKDDAKDKVITNKYSYLGELAQLTEAETASTSSSTSYLTYIESNGNFHKQIKKTTAADGGVAKSTLDRLYRAISTSVSDAALGINNLTSISYDAFGRISGEVDANLATKTTKYLNSFGVLNNTGAIVETTLDALSRKVTTEVDFLGRTLKVTNSLNQTTSFTYDNKARTSTLTTAEGLKTTTKKNAFGQEVEISDDKGVIKTYTYTKDGLLDLVKDAYGNILTDNEYDASGRLERLITYPEKNASGTTTKYEYDAANRVIRETYNYGGQIAGILTSVTTYKYDAQGRRWQVNEGVKTVNGVDEATKTTEYTFDRKGQVKTMVVDPAGVKLTTTYIYDAVGRVTEVQKGDATNLVQQKTAYVYDKLGRKIEEKIFPDGTNAVTTYFKYDANNNLTRVTDGNGNNSWYVYNEANEKVYTVDALGGVTKNVFDAAGRVIRTTQFATAVTPPAGTVTALTIGSFQAPATNVLDKITDFVYDKDGRLRFTVKWDGAVGTSTTKQRADIDEKLYDARNNVIESRTYSFPLLVSQTYVSEADIKAALPDWFQMVDFPQAKLTRYFYDAANRLRFELDGEGGLTERVYGYISAVKHYSVKLDVTKAWTYDNLVQTTTLDTGFMAEPVSGESYFADTLGRTITQSSIGALVAALDRDGAGNVTRVSDPNGYYTWYVYNKAGQKTFEVNALGEVTGYTYNAVGQVLTITRYTNRLNTSAFGEVVSINAPSAHANDRQTRFVYDGAGRQRFVVELAVGGSSQQWRVSETQYDKQGNKILTRTFASLFTKLEIDTAYASNSETGLAALTLNKSARTTRYVYDALNRQRFVVDAENYLTETRYNPKGLVITKIAYAAALASIANNEYTESKVSQTLTTNADDRRTDYEYFGNGKLYRELAPSASFTLKDGSSVSGRKITKYEYKGIDSQDFHIYTGGILLANSTINYESSREVFYEFDQAGRQIEIRNEAGITTITYDGRGNAVKSFTKKLGDYDGYNVYKVYDQVGRVRFDIDENRFVTEYVYDQLGNVRFTRRYDKAIAAKATTLNSDGTSPFDENYYKSANEVQTLLTNAGASYRQTETIYDALGRKKTVKQDVTTNNFTPSTTANSLATTVQTYGSVATTEFEYNSFGDLIKEKKLIDIQGGNYAENYYYYDSLGRRTAEINPEFYLTETQYNAFGERTFVAEYASRASAVSAGAYTPVRTADKDRLTGFTYNQLGQLKETILYNSFSATGNSLSGIDSELNFYEWNANPDNNVNTRDGRWDKVGYNDFAVTLNQYNAFGQLKSVTSKAKVATVVDQVTTYQYDALGQLVKITFPTTNVVKAGVVDPFSSGGTENKNPESNYSYDVFGQMRKETGLNTLERKYDDVGNLTEETANGQTKTFAYDKRGRVISEKSTVAARLAGQASDLYNHVIEKRYIYDFNGRQVAALNVVTLADNTKRQAGEYTEFNAHGEIVKKYAVTALASDAADYSTLIGSKFAKAEIESYEYDTNGRVSQKSAADGRTFYYYNLLGQVTRSIQTGGDSTPNFAASSGHRVTEYVYDKLGRALTAKLPRTQMTSVTNGWTATAVVQSTSSQYDRWGNVIAFTNTAGVTTQYQYNQWNKLIKETYQAESYYASTSAAMNNQATFANLSREYHYDVSGHLVQEADYSNTTLLRRRVNEYNDYGQLIAKTDGTGVREEFLYDIKGNKVATRNALGVVKLASYDTRGNQTETAILKRSDNAAYFSGVDMAGAAKKVVTKAYAYDTAGRRFSELAYFDENGSVASNTAGLSYYTYDAMGNLLKAVNAANIATSYEFNEFGQKTKETNALGYNTRWSYQFGAVNKMSSDTRAATEMVYVYSGALSQIANYDQANTLLTKTVYEYNGFGATRREIQTNTTYMSKVGLAIGSDLTTDTGLGAVVTTHDYLSDGKEKSLEKFWNHSRTTSAPGIGATDASSVREFFKLTTSYEYGENNKVSRQTDTSLVAARDVSNTLQTRTASRLQRVQYDSRDRVYNVSSDSATSGVQYLAYNANFLLGSATGTEQEYGQHRFKSEAVSISFRYDAFGNKLRISSTINSSATDSRKASYDLEGRVTSTDEDHAMVYNAAGALTLRAVKLSDNVWGAQLIVRNEFGQNRTEASTGNLAVSTAADALAKIQLNGTSTTTIKFNGSVVNLGAVSRETTYDLQGRQKTLKITNGDVTQKDTSYYADGRVKNIYDKKNGTNTSQTDYSAAGAYDLAGNLKSYVYRNFGSGSDNFTNTYTLSYGNINGEYKNIKTNVTSTSTYYAAVTTFLGYDVFGNLIAKNPMPDETSFAPPPGIPEIYVYNAEGKLTGKLPSSGTNKQLYYVEGVQVGQVDGVVTGPNVAGSRYLLPISSPSEFGFFSGAEESISPDNELLTYYTTAKRFGVPIKVANKYDLPSQPNASSVAQMASIAVVQKGATLSSMAKTYFGDSSLWYLIAEANGVTKGANELLDVYAGQSFTIPNTSRALKNSASAYKPYMPSEIIGNTTPQPLFVPPPQKSCNPVAMVIMAVVAIVVTVYTAGAAASLVSTAMGTTVAGGAAAAGAAGAAVLAGGTVGAVGIGAGIAGTMAAIGVAFVAGAAGSVAAQLVGKGLGAVEKFNLRDAARAGLTSVATMGAGYLLSQMGEAVASVKTVGNITKPTFTKLGSSLLAAGSYMGGYLAGKAAGIPESHFNWTDVAIAAITPAVTNNMGNGVLGAINSNANGFTANFAANFYSSTVSSTLKRLLGRGEAQDWAAMGIDAFGNALGGEIVARATPKVDDQAARFNDPNRNPYFFAVADIDSKGYAPEETWWDRASAGFSSLMDNLRERFVDVPVIGAFFGRSNNGLRTDAYGNSEIIVEGVSEYERPSTQAVFDSIMQDPILRLRREMGAIPQGPQLSSWSSRADELRYREQALAITQGQAGLAGVPSFLMKSDTSTLGKWEASLAGREKVLESWMAVGGLAGLKGAPAIGAAPSISRGTGEPKIEFSTGSRTNFEAVSSFEGMPVWRDVNRVTVYRVDDNAFGPRILEDGSIPVVMTKSGDERALFVNFGQLERAEEFKNVNRKGNATITAVDTDISLLERLRITSVYDRSVEAKLNPSAPLRVDIKQAPDQFGLRTSEHIQWLREAIDPSTVRIIQSGKP